MGGEVRAALVDAHRREWARVVASTVRVARDLDLAEESAQEAFAEALTIWSRDGVPTNPGAWLTTVARRRAIDSLRRAASQQRKLPLLVEPERLEAVESSGSDVETMGEGALDDTMRLIFMCCHPSLSREAQTALTLRLVCGMVTADIAKCFLVSESTMAARLTRAKKKITVARIPFRSPRADELGVRLDGVLGVIYLLFTVGHTSPEGDVLIREDSTREALRLARLLHDVMPDEPEVTGLLALLLVIEARQESRVDQTGAPQRISEQDRSTWDREAIGTAHEMILSSLQTSRPGRYTLQAAIASLHAHAPTFDDVDWPQIVVLYDALLLVWPSPVVKLNRAVAMSKISGPLVALEIVEGLERDGKLDRYQYLPAVKAHLLEQLDRRAEAERERSRAMALSANQVEREFLASGGREFGAVTSRGFEHL
jgi:RNA polymerase sigma factor (sigma-70 family)